MEAFREVVFQYPVKQKDDQKDEKLIQKDNCEHAVKFNRRSIKENLFPKYRSLLRIRRVSWGEKYIYCFYDKLHIIYVSQHNGTLLLSVITSRFSVV